MQDVLQLDECECVCTCALRYTIIKMSLKVKHVQTNTHIFSSSAFLLQSIIMQHAVMLIHVHIY